jgi:hypothetical protein
MSLKRAVWVGGFLCVLALSGPGLEAFPDGGPAVVPNSFTVQDVKVQWFSKGEEELPGWINARFETGPMGVVAGTVTETDLEADGLDEDGDPSGFETSVFDTSDGSLRELSLGRNAVAFTTVFPDQASGRVTYAFHRSATVQGGWVLSAIGKSSKGLSYGHNRFPLAGDEKKQGVLQIYTAPDTSIEPLPSL